MHRPDHDLATTRQTIKLAVIGALHVDLGTAAFSVTLASASTQNRERYDDYHDPSTNADAVTFCCRLPLGRTGFLRDGSGAWRCAKRLLRLHLRNYVLVSGLWGNYRRMI